MINLIGHATTPDFLKLISSTGATLDVEASYMDMDNSLLPGNAVNNVGSQKTAISSATTTPIVAGVTNANHRRNVKELTIRNKHATLSCDVTVVVDAIDGVDYEKCKMTLLPGWTLEYGESYGFYAIAPQIGNGSLYNVSTASQTGFAADTYVTGSDLPIGGRLKQGTLMRWTIHMTKTAAGIATPAVIVRFGTAGAIADTARCTLAGPAQTAAVDEAMLEIEAVVWAHSATVGVVRTQMALDHSAAIAAGFGEMFDGVTSGNFDTTVGNNRVGISMNGGTSAAWTLNLVTAEATNLA